MERLIILESILDMVRNFVEQREGLKSHTLQSDLYYN